MNSQQPPTPPWVMVESPKPSRRKWYIAGGVLGALILMSIGYGMGTDRGQQGFNDGVTAATATDAPVSTATPEPTEDQGTAAYLVYAAHNSAVLPDVVDTMSAAGEAFTNYDILDAEVHLKELRTLLRTEIAWLDNNPPAACYATIHREQRAAYADYLDAADAGLDFLDTFKEKYADEFIRKVDSGRAHLESATDLIDKVCK
jgi:hypothetical protein